MHRRLLLTALACWPAVPLLAADEAPRPRHKISAGQLHDALSARFPVRFGLAGLLALQVSAPRLHLLPARNRLGAGLVAEVDGLQLGQASTGELDVAFALRYEAADRSVRAHGLEILDLRWPGLPPETLRTLQALLPAMAREAVGEVVLQRLTPRELALADTMGLQPQEFQVVDDGLLILFGPQPGR